MRVIHGIWAQDALCLWAEDPGPRAAARAGQPGAGAASVRLPGRRAGRPAGRAARSGRRGGRQGRPTTSSPCSCPRPGGPARAARLARAHPADAAEPGRRPGVRLARWRVPVLAFEPAAAALDLLAALRDPGELGAVAAGRLAALPGRAGRASPTAWRARGRVLPVLDRRGRRTTRPGGGRCSAAPTRSARVTWPRPCPPSCRAAVADGEPDGSAPGPLLAAALDRPGRRRGADPPARLPPARQARPYSGSPSFGRTVRGRTDQHRCSPGRGDARGTRPRRPTLAAELDAWLDRALGSRPARCGPASA